MFDEAEIGRIWREMAKAEGHKARHPVLPKAQAKLLSADAARRRKKIVTYFKNHPGAYGSAARKVLRINTHTFANDLGLLRAEGKITATKSHNGFWRYYVL